MGRANIALGLPAAGRPKILYKTISVKLTLDSRKEVKMKKWLNDRKDAKKIYAEAPRDYRKDKQLYNFALSANIIMIIAFSLAFVRKEYDFYDVPLGAVLVSLGFVGVYATNRHRLRRQNGNGNGNGNENDIVPENRSGDKMFNKTLKLFVFMFFLWITKIPHKTFDIQFDEPMHFYTFIEGLVVIVGGGDLIDFVTRPKKN